MEQISTVMPYLLATMIALLLGLQVSEWLVRQRLVGRPAPELTDLLGPEAPGAGRRVIYFHNPHCVACRAMTPRVRRLAEEHPEIATVDVQKSRAVAARLGVTFTPTLVVIQGGKITAALVGPQSERSIRALLNRQTVTA
jgi:thiol-disulfide isomerase/thioredoxin